MFMKNFLNSSICLISVTIHKTQIFFDQANKKVIGKMKHASEGKIIDEFVGLKPEMCSIKSIDGKEFSKDLFQMMGFILLHTLTYFHSE